MGCVAIGNHDGRDAAWRDLCADLNLDSESNDTHGLHRRRRRNEKRSARDWRDRRLCGQVRRAVQMGLADCGDPALQTLIVLAVEPTPRTACLCVHVLTPADTATTGDAAAAPLPARLHAAAPRLRAEVARSIHRKKTPQLVFQLHTKEEHDEPS